ncbi:MAG: efflux transporter periplasmic adaptor subunit [Gammaproteobacteria bacterium RIFCSPLOWO2_02_FULL_61_13]|nr:MAG: efflux transporter periplasmic adaptor subunit [Gammaproteobacteria bacterium RIFCSPLOWO2_02_FULL_61_13]
MNLLRRHAGLIAAALALIGLLALGFRPSPVSVDMVQAQAGPLRLTVEEEGRTRVIDRYVISAPVPGYLRRIDLDVGAALSPGQVVAQLEPLRSDVLDPRRRAEAESRVVAARAAVQAAEQRAGATEAEADYAASEQERHAQLYKNRTVSLDAFQQAEAAARRTRASLQSARFQVDVARAELKAAEATVAYSSAAGTGGRLEQVTITAPVGGQLLKRFHESEGVVAAGEPLLEVGDPLSLEVEVDVLSRDAVRIAPGMPVQLERWGGAVPLQGTVRTVEPVGFTKISALGVEEQRVLVIVDITSPREQWQRLGDGYRVEAVFILWQGESVLQVPSSALFRSGADWSLFVVESGRAITRPVKAGHEGGINVQILDGVRPGDWVVAHPGDAVADGVRVQAY